MYLPIHAEAGLRAAPESAQRHVDDDHDGGGDDGEHRAQVAARLVPGVAALIAGIWNDILLGKALHTDQSNNLQEVTQHYAPGQVCMWLHEQFI